MQMNDRSLISMVCSELAGYYTDLKMYPEASRCIQIIRSNERQLEKLPTLSVLSGYFEAVGQLDSATYYYNRMLASGKPLYKMTAYDMFNEMLASIQQDTLRLLYHVRIEQKVEREQVAKVTGTNKDETGPKKPVQRAEKKIYPNDPCPCGSGKKYKHCCGRVSV